MLAEKIYNYTNLAITAVTTIFAFIKYFQAKKSSKSAKETAKENEKLRKVNTLAKIIQQIPELVSKAERLFPTTGEIKFGPQKLEYVLKELQIFCNWNAKRSWLTVAAVAFARSAYTPLLIFSLRFGNLNPS